MSLYYQYGTGGPTAMQAPDYQTFLKLLEQMRQQQGGSGGGGGGGGVNMQGFAQFANKFFPNNSTPDLSGATKAAGTNYFDTPTGGMSGIAGLIA